MEEKKAKVLLGSRTPTFQNYSYDSYEDLELVWSEEQIKAFLLVFNVVLLDWQMDILKTLLRRSEDSESGGSKLEVEVLGLIVPRQNGKTEVLVAYILICFFMGRNVVYSSYRESSAEDVYQRFCGAIKNSPLFEDFQLLGSRGRYKRAILKMGGEEFAETIFITRGGDFGRGLTKKDVLIFDESQNLQEKQVSGVEALLTVSSTPQKLFVGTPSVPAEDMATGKTVSLNPFWSKMKKKIVGSETRKSLWIEWSTKRIHAPGDLQVAAKYNPSLGYDLGGGYKMSTTNFTQSSASNLNYSIERLGYQLDDTVFDTTDFFPVSILKKSLLDKKGIHEEFNKHRKYVVSIKSNLKNSQIYVSKVTNFKGKIFCSLDRIYNTSDNNSIPELMDYILKENQKIRCHEIVLDGRVSGTIGSYLEKAGRIKKTGSNFGKFKFVKVSDVTTAAHFFNEQFKNGSVFFPDFLGDFLKDYLPNLKRRKVRDGFSYTSSTHDHEVFETFSVGALFMNKLPWVPFCYL